MVHTQHRYENKKNTTQKFMRDERKKKFATAQIDRNYGNQLDYERKCTDSWVIHTKRG